MTSICQEQAELSALLRHFDRTIALVMEDREPARAPERFLVIQGECDDITPPSAAHPAARALRAAGRGHRA